MGLLDVLQQRSEQRRADEERVAEFRRNRAQQKRARADREAATNAFVQANPDLRSAIGFDPNSPQSQGLLQGLASIDPAARNLAGAAVGNLQAQGAEIAGRPEAAQAQQRSDLLFGLDVDKKIGDIRSTELSNISAEDAIRRLRRADESGFASPKEAIEFGQQVQALSGALRATDQMIFIRDQMGAVGPVDFIANPEAAAAVDMFQSFETVVLFKNLADDPRVSDEDRDFYRSIIDLGVTDWLFTGGKVELAKLNDLQRRLSDSMDIFARHPGAGNFSNFFERANFGGDIPGAITRQPGGFFDNLNRPATARMTERDRNRIREGNL